MPRDEKHFKANSETPTKTIIVKQLTGDKNIVPTPREETLCQKESKWNNRWFDSECEELIKRNERTN